MASVDELITSLTETAAPTRPAAGPFILFLRWSAYAVLYIAILLFFFGFRDDIRDQLNYNSLFRFEIGALASLLIASLLSASTLSFPDMHQKELIVWLPVLPLLCFIDVLYASWLIEVQSTPWMGDTRPRAPLPDHDIICLLCITLFSVLPAAVMIRALRQQATTHYYAAGGIALLASSSLGCLTLRLSEKTNSIPHLVEWHYLPMAGFSLLGLWLGRRYLKW
jgi:hypothetical protein